MRITPINQNTTVGSQSSAATVGNLFATMMQNQMNQQAMSLGDISGSSMGTGYMSSYGMGMMNSGGSDFLTTMLLILLLMQSEEKQTSTDTDTDSLFGSNVSNSSFGSTFNYGATPEEAWKPCTPGVKSYPGQRSASAYRAVIDQFNVENNPRYAVNKKGVGDTYCNIFAWDVTSAMGAEIPHYTDKETGAPMTYPNTSGSMAMTANRINDWLNDHGRTYGWYKTTPEEAQRLANMGYPAVTSWKNSSGHGHMQVVSPSANGGYDETRGAAIAQAGRQLINNGYVSDSYGRTKMSQVEYFVHM